MTLDRHIRIYDPAIDWSESGGTPPEYARTRDESALVLRPGKRPLVFSCTRLSVATFRWVSAAPSDVERLERAFRAGVRHVEHAEGMWSPAGVDGREYVAMTDHEASRYGIADILEIGGLVYERSVLPTDCEASYTLRPTSHLVLDAAIRASRYAERSQGVPAPTASEPAASSGA
jgi:hypothetical protein